MKLAVLHLDSRAEHGIDYVRDEVRNHDPEGKGLLQKARPFAQNLGNDIG